MEDDTGEIVLSRKKAHRMRQWEKVISKNHEGDVVKGRVTKKIKGGLLVDIGVNVFLPASQVDIRRPSDIADYIDREIECMILKIDESRRNIVVSRRKLIEEQRAIQKAKLLSEIEPGRSARASSRTSPTSARSSISAASTASCTSPTCRGAGSTTRATWSGSTTRSR